MAQQLIAIDAEALATLIAKVDSLQAEIRAARIAPEPQWLTVKQYADKIGRSERTVLRRVEAGQIEARHLSGVRMVRV